MDTKDNGSAVLERPGRKGIAPRRPVKVQICLTPQERVLLSERARAAGFETVSGFVRAQTLGGPLPLPGVARLTTKAPSPEQGPI